VLAHLTPAQRTAYACLIGALERRFGHHQQAEVYRARLKARMRARGEPFPQLAQEVETLVRRAYPAAAEDMVAVLTRDYFVDALQDRALQLYVKQAHPEDVQVALARALELEAFLETTGEAGGAPFPQHAPRPASPCHHLRVRRTQARKPVQRREASPEGFRGTCWGCGQAGHRRSQCGRERKLRSLDELRLPTRQPCCWNFGELGHMAGACQRPNTVQPLGNTAGLGAGAASQPTTPTGPRVV